MLRLYLRYRCAWTELITLDLICPATYQLLWNSSSDSGSNLSLDKPASLERLFSLARVSLSVASKPNLSFGCSAGDYTSSNRKIPFEEGRPSSKYGKGRKKQDGANGVRNNKMSFVIQHHNREDRNEKPRSSRFYHPLHDQIPQIREQVILRSKSNSERGPNSDPMSLEKTRSKESTKEVFTINQECPEQGKRRANILNGIPVQMFTSTSKRIQPNKNGGRGQRKDWVSYGGRSILFHPYAERIKELYCYTLKDDEKCLSRSKRTLEEIVIKSKSELDLVQDVEETLRKLKRLNIKIDPAMSSFGVKEGRNKTISSMLLVEREGIQIPISYVSQPLQGMEICYTPTEKMVQTLIHTTRSLRTIFRKHKVKVVTDEPIEEILKLSGGGRLAKWAAKIRTYDISYILRKEVEGLVVKKLFGQGEQVERTPDANKEGTLTLRKELQSKSTPTPKAWRLYLGKETIKEGLGVGIILVSLEEKEHLYATRLKFKASNHVMDYEALLAGLAASSNQGIKDFRVFIDSLTLVAQVEGNRTPVTEHERKYKE
uniref:Reverse transcriptase RNase H-like domain-containing protein n=1 Tax=Tanacetum cinerariifolium TaxID=118510 RepID=A0A699GS68_TANCI|nr:hypothetical protein [Tanacetum cinerariifolium]